MWTEQTVETLKKFASEGKSAAWIAAALGAPSRNAVIGKANRIGIKLNGGMGPTSSKTGVALGAAVAADPLGPEAFIVDRAGAALGKADARRYRATRGCPRAKPRYGHCSRERADGPTDLRRG